MTWVQVVASVLLLIGSLLAVTAAVGVLRFPDTLARMHAATKPQTLGLVFVLGGSAMLLGRVDVGMLFLAAIFQLVTAPVIAQRVGRLAHQEQCYRDDLLIVDHLSEDLAAQEQMQTRTRSR